MIRLTVLYPNKSDAKDYSKTLYLPQTEFPMRAGLPQRAPILVVGRIECQYRLPVVQHSFSGTIGWNGGAINFNKMRR
jgi:hypothetical protein